MTTHTKGNSRCIYIYIQIHIATNALHTYEQHAMKEILLHNEEFFLDLINKPALEIQEMISLTKDTK